MFAITTKRIINHKDEIIKLYKKGKSLTFLAKYFNDDKRNIRKLLEDNGITVINPSPSPYKLDENYFDNIDTQNKAYILGFLYADGCNTKGNKIKISLQDVDKEILEKMAKELKTDKPLGFYNRSNKNPNHHDVYELVIYNKHMSNQLKELGCVPRKSLILEFPDFLEEELLPHFIRGYFDGDGHITKYRGYNCNIVSSFKFCEKLGMKLTEIGIKNKVSPDKNNQLTGRMCIYTKEDSKMFLDYIYKDAELYMERKYKIYMNKFYINNNS